MKKPILILIAGAVLVLIMIVMFVKSKSEDTSSTDEMFVGIAGDPVDVTMDFYRIWTTERSASSASPYSSVILENIVLSTAMQEKLAATKETFETDGTDPVLCQNDIPNRLRSKVIYQNDDGAKIIVFAKDTPGIQSVASLKTRDGLWHITDIQCVIGEQDPNQGEFTFDKEGQLLKDSLKPPLDNQYWHLVFEQDGTFGYTAPLFLSESSTCILNNGSEEICRDDMFSETQKVHVQGDMTESGVEVKRIEMQ